MLFDQISDLVTIDELELLAPPITGRRLQNRIAVGVVADAHLTNAIHMAQLDRFDQLPVAIQHDAHRWHVEVATHKRHYGALWLVELIVGVVLTATRLTLALVCVQFASIRTGIKRRFRCRSNLIIAGVK
jgi:hypothetical protein